MTRSLVWLVLLVGLGACDGPPAEDKGEAVEAYCDAALGKLQQECQIQIDQATLDAVNCDDEQRCAADCVESASCGDITLTLQGAINTFSACIDVCAGRPIRQYPEACKQAEAKLNECGLILTGVCTELTTCFTNCVANYSCGDINASVVGASSGFALCMQGC